MSDNTDTRRSSPATHWRSALLLLGLAGALQAGCGGAQERRSTVAENPPVRKVEANGPAHQPAIVAGVAACRQGVDTGRRLTKARKQRLYGICDLGLRRALPEVRVYGLQVCTEVMYASSAKTRAEKLRVFATCYAALKKQLAAHE